MYLLGGSVGWMSPVTNEVWASLDGLNWAQKSDAPWAKRWEHIGVVFNGQVVIGLGFDSSTTMKDMWATSDMVNWVQKADFGGGARHGACGIVFNSRLYVLKGASAVDLWSTSDLSTWTQVTVGNVWSDRFEYSCAVFNGAIFIHGGNDWSSLANDLWYSTGCRQPSMHCAHVYHFLTRKAATHVFAYVITFRGHCWHLLLPLYALPCGRLL